MSQVTESCLHSLTSIQKPICPIQLLGASHFVFYNHTMGPDVRTVLMHYVSHGEATILRWNLPVASKKEIRTEGIFTALNDCNLRLVNR